VVEAHLPISFPHKGFFFFAPPPPTVPSYIPFKPHPSLHGYCQNEAQSFAHALLFIKRSLFLRIHPPVPSFPVLNFVPNEATQPI